jgi:aryl-alcohol dehydrogenase-like predicted oxidoreductase
MGQFGVPAEAQFPAVMRLALGTVQFGQKYGIANVSGQVGAATAAAILARARTAHVDTLDTAIAYGNSEACLGEAGVSEWRVVTKLPPLPAGVANASVWAEEQAHSSLRRLRIEQLEALLLHSPADLLGESAHGLIGALESLKAKGLIRAAGISIYNPTQLELIWKVWQPDLVQVPCNVLDRRLIRSGWLERLCRQGVRIHVRSLFLQGLLLMSAPQRPVWFGRWSELLDRWLNWCNANEVLPIEAALAFAQSVPGVERLIVGVDSAEQWEEVLAASVASTTLPPEDFASEDPDLIEPSRWILA